VLPYFCLLWYLSCLEFIYHKYQGLKLKTVLKLVVSNNNYNNEWEICVILSMSCLQDDHKIPTYINMKHVLTCFGNRVLQVIITTTVMYHRILFHRQRAFLRLIEFQTLKYDQLKIGWTYQEKFPAFYRTQRFITAFTRAFHYKGHFT